MKTYEKICVSQTLTIREVMQVIELGAMQIALVVNQDKKLLGTITDGDIRRGLLNGLNLEDKVKDIFTKNPVIGYQTHSNDQILELALNYDLKHVPIVDQQGTLLGIKKVEDLVKPEQKENIVVLMAGGQGMRLRPLTETVPKPLLNVGGKPILETIIRSFRKHGFTKFYLSVNYKYEMIQSNFEDGSSLGVSIQYIEEKNKMGTAGALSKLKGKISQPFFVMNGDILTNVNFNNFLAFHEEKQAVATMGVRSYEHQIPYGVIHQEKNSILAIKEKPIHTEMVNAGVYIFNPEVLEQLEDDTYIDMPDVFNLLLKKNKSIHSYSIKDYWVDIGRLDELNRANSEYDEVF